MSWLCGSKRSITTLPGNRMACVVAVFLASAFTAFLDRPAAVAADAPVLVILRNHQFEPKLLRVRSGQIIRFDNADDALHSLLLVGYESVIGEEFVDPGQSYTVRIPPDLASGTYELACTIHVDMRGQIAVSSE